VNTDLQVFMTSFTRWNLNKALSKKDCSDQELLEALGMYIEGMHARECIPLEKRTWLIALVVADIFEQGFEVPPKIVARLLTASPKRGYLKWFRASCVNELRKKRKVQLYMGPVLFWCGFLLASGKGSVTLQFLLDYTISMLPASLRPTEKMKVRLLEVLEEKVESERRCPECGNNHDILKARVEHILKDRVEHILKDSCGPAAADLLGRGCEREDEGEQAAALYHLTLANLELHKAKGAVITDEEEAFKQVLRTTLHQAHERGYPVDPSLLERVEKKDFPPYVLLEIEGEKFFERVDPTKN
jgi:hypothetical protein